MYISGCTIDRQKSAFTTSYDGTGMLTAMAYQSSIQCSNGTLRVAAHGVSISIQCSNGTLRVAARGVSISIHIAIYTV